jgi:hypothetical protein
MTISVEKIAKQIRVILLMNAHTTYIDKKWLNLRKIVHSGHPDVEIKEGRRKRS